MLMDFVAYLITAMSALVLFLFLAAARAHTVWQRSRVHTLERYARMSSLKSAQTGLFWVLIGCFMTGWIVFSLVAYRIIPGTNSASLGCFTLAFVLDALCLVAGLAIARRITAS